MYVILRMDCDGDNTEAVGYTPYYGTAVQYVERKRDEDDGKSYWYEEVDEIK